MLLLREVIYVRSPLLHTLAAYVNFFPEYHIPALVVMDGVTELATAMQNSREEYQEVIAELVWLGARHGRWWKVTETDFRAVVIAALHALSSHHEWTPGGAKDLLSWRIVLCEMVAVMCRGITADDREVGQVKAKIQSMKAKSSYTDKFAGSTKAKKARDRCKVM
ncbi:hypothetical protein HDU93_002624 [Gonapodya sp. JEL0774]|nr:hypothetical protein HDU93_002624 [Gonapodya sp. JEL0774]